MIQLRPATMNDAARLFVWRNDEATREQSQSSHPIAFKDHLAWLEKTIDNADVALFVAQDIHKDGIWVGSGRLDVRSKKRVELSVTVDATRRGAGYGAAIIASLIGQAIKRREVWKFDTLLAHVKESNGASLRAFWEHGFRAASYGVKGTEPMVITLECTLSKETQ